MTRSCHRLLPGLAVAVVLAGCSPVGMSPSARPVIEVDAEIRDLVELVNDHRDEIGCKKLTWSTPIADVAQRHAADMARRSYFSHTSPEGMSPFQRLAAAGIRYSKAAENIAYGQPTARHVFQSWLSSPGHRRNIEDCAFREHGIGFAPGSNTVAFGGVKYAWTHNFVLTRQ